MKLLTPILILAITILTAATCNKSTTGNTKCFKGRLEIKGICMNYVIKVLDGDTTALNLEKTWVDETTDKTYQNVFGLGNKCDFPDLAEGEEFYFTIEEKPTTDCAVCQAFRPTPAAKNNIKVSKTPCP
jgi:hypothetical protein